MWFSEVSLFTRTLHRSTLTAATFADAYSLAAGSFSDCVKQSPSAAMFVIKYAGAYLNMLWEGDAHNIPTGAILVDDILPKSLSEAACKAAIEKKQEKIALEEPPLAKQEAVQALLSGICKKTLSDAEVRQQLPLVFGELDLERGLYQQASEKAEQERVTCAMMSVFWLLADQHSSFIEAQPQAKQMSASLWQEWQRFVVFTDLSEESVHVLLAFLCIRGLGKSKFLAKQIDMSERAAPEEILKELLERGLIPSVSHFTPDMHQLLRSMITINEKFILPQFLQGENLPCHIQALEACVAIEGEVALKCYLFALVAMMCGLLANRNGKGSLFMDNSNGRTVLLGIQCLMNLGTATPHAIYWNYISLRASGLEMTIDTPEQCTIARLACLTRATTADVETLQSAWDSLSKAERSILVDFFLADGILKRAEVYTFLPLYFQNARNNPAVGLSLAFEVLVNLVDLRQKDKKHQLLDNVVVEINLSDLASFAAKVKNRQIFKLVSQHSLYLQQGDALHHLVSGDLWCQVNSVARAHDTNLKDVTYILTKIERETASMQHSLHSVTRRIDKVEKQTVSTKWM
jgi:hypothetical protein